MDVCVARNSGLHQADSTLTVHGLHMTRTSSKKNSAKIIALELGPGELSCCCSRLCN